ncbi:hypothetical protein AB0A77_36250 [Streptomyces varsoviensis]|uniref:hypothetical protein n=1 Tax=Streptomyces varsoviensis TaxID=67373 RepID=UPI0033CE1D5F
MSGDFGQERDRARVSGANSQVGMRLDGAPAGPLGPGESGNFASTPAAKSAAAGTIETELEPDTKKAAKHAEDSTGAARRGFEGWDTAAGLKTVADTWDLQVKALMGRLAAEKIALRGASSLFVRNDIGVGDQFPASHSKLDDF